MEKLSENFSAFAAILKRPDLDITLSNAYTSLLDKNLDSASLIKKGEYSFHISFLELLISYSFQQSKNKNANNQLYLNQLLRAYDKKKNNPEVFGYISLSTCVWAMNSILLADKASEHFAMKDSFIQKGNTFPDATIRSIANGAETFLKETKAP